MPHNPEDFRPNVGMMIINQKKEIFVGKRIDHPSEFWQMPQGGIDAQEEPSIASLRDMEEEVGLKKNKVEEMQKLHSRKLFLNRVWDTSYKNGHQKMFLARYEEKPIATIENLKARAENGSLLSIIGFVVMKAEDHSKTNMNGKILIILSFIFKY